VSGNSDLVAALARTSMGIGLVLLPLLAMGALIFIWPINSEDSKTLLPLPIFNSNLQLDHRLFFIVILAGVWEAMFTLPLHSRRMSETAVSINRGRGGIS
jgi:hypothetical protein